ncbi:hypothetical protein FACS1894178_6190 [Bacteroidia bacterium]|nr:hypothetical protein FACS1894178_6190 [Bacteroidia bacterium]
MPKKIDISNPIANASNDYIYAADGRKLQVKQTWTDAAPVSFTGRQMSPQTKTMTKNYCSNIIFKNDSLDMILTENGYIKDGMYHYFVKDYLGNNRLVMNEYGMIVQKNNYYPFGMTQLVDAEQQDGVPYKFSGKELESDGGLNLYDFSARFYDASTGRFGQIDPMAEKYYPISPYAYCGNNPTRYVDFKGDSISVPQQYQEQFNQDLENAFGDNASLFSFNEKGILIFNGKKKDLTKEQKSVFNKMNKLMKEKDTYTVSYESSYSPKDGSAPINVDGKEAGGAMYYPPDKAIVVSPNMTGGDVTSVESNSFLKQVYVEMNTTTALFHEIGEALMGKKQYRGGAVDLENCVRNILKMARRPYDVQHQPQPMPTFPQNNSQF